MPEFSNFNSFMVFSGFYGIIRNLINPKVYYEVAKTLGAKESFCCPHSYTQCCTRYLYRCFNCNRIRLSDFNRFGNGRCKSWSGLDILTGLKHGQLMISVCFHYYYGSCISIILAVLTVNPQLCFTLEEGNCKMSKQTEHVLIEVRDVNRIYYDTTGKQTEALQNVDLRNQKRRTDFFYRAKWLWQNNTSKVNCRAWFTSKRQFIYGK